MYIAMPVTSLMLFHNVEGTYFLEILKIFETFSPFHDVVRRVSQIISVESSRVSSKWLGR